MYHSRSGGSYLILIVLIVGLLVSPRVALARRKVAPKPAQTPASVVTPVPAQTPAPVVTPLPAPIPSVSGPAYFIDSVAGNDLNAGTSDTAPWRTLAKVQSALNAGSIAPGTSFLFKSGDVWTASNKGNPMVSLPTGLNGANGNPILFATYGSGPAPVFDGSSGLATACFYGNGASAATPYVSYVAISGFECRNTSLYGVYFHQYSGSGAGMPGIIVENMNIHNTGPGAFSGADLNNSCGPSPCDDGNYRNQLMFEDDSYALDGAQLLSNLVDTCGGHNCIELQGDMGAGTIQNSVCYSWTHNCIDVKQSVGILVKGNIVHGGTATQGSAFYYENDNSPANGSITWEQNLAYSASNGLECENGTPTQHTVACSAYNNTLYLGSESAIVSASTSGLTWDVRNNILDTTDPIFVCDTMNSNSCGEITTWNYNDDGGSHGYVNTAVVGPNDLTGGTTPNNPLYVDAAGADFHLQAGSPCINTGDPTLGAINIGAF